MSGEESVSMNDFVSFFDEIKLPVTISDSILKKPVNDSNKIGVAVWNQFIGDSIFSSFYGVEKPAIYAIGRFRNQEEETYLLVRTQGKTKKGAYVISVSPQEKFSAYMLLLGTGKQNNEVDRVTIDSKFNFTLTDQYKDLDGSLGEYSTVYAYNNAGLFMVILKDGMQKGEIRPIINPIDTLPATFKFSGDYGKDDRNFISIRDGKNKGEFLFFINFDKGASTTCQSELKGEAVFINTDSALFETKTDPCKIGFVFSKNRVTINEINNCGNWRPADCNFNASYSRLKTKKNI